MVVLAYDDVLASQQPLLVSGMEALSFGRKLFY